MALKKQVLYLVNANKLTSTDLNDVVLHPKTREVLNTLIE